MQSFNLRLNYLQNYCICFLFFTSLCSYSQTSPEEKADTYFSNKNYVDALDTYKKLFEQEPDNLEYNLRLALCYLNTYGEKARAIKHLEYVLTKKNTDPDVLFSLGLAYQHAYQFNNAISTFENAKKNANGKFVALIDRQIETCFNGQELVKFPLDVTIKSLGKEINSPYPEYYPFIPKDESFMIFTTRRPDKTNTNKELDGYYSSDIYISYPIDGKWTKAIPLPGRINTQYDEQAVDLSNKGDRMIVYIDKIDSMGNIYYANNSKMGFQGIVKFPTNINEGIETAGSLSESENILIFASDRPGGFGGRDLYLTLKLPNGKWGVPQNLGPNINTIFNEDFPHLSSDEKTLYFASEGHSSMGGYDIFRTIGKIKENKWPAPQNIGYPINDTDDNMNISYSNDTTLAFVSSVTPEGGLDIQKVIFNTIENRYSVVRGIVSAKDTTINIENLKTTIVAERADIVAFYKYKPIKNSGRYIMALQPGEYKIKIEAEGFETYNFPLTILDIPFQSELIKDIKLVARKK